MRPSQGYIDRISTTEKINSSDSRIWGSIHRTYALVMLVAGGIGSYQAKDIGLATAVAILAAAWAIVFQLIATTKLVHRALMMIHASQERKVLAGISEGRLTRPAESSVAV